MNLAWLGTVQWGGRPADSRLTVPLTLQASADEVIEWARLSAVQTAVWLCSEAPGPHVIGEPKLLLPVVVLPEPLLGEDVMDKLINELLLLTCMGTFIASATYAVTLLH